MESTTTTATARNGVDVQQLTTIIEEVKREPWRARFSFTVNSEWKGGLRAQHANSGFVLGDETYPRASHSITTDEPKQILGNDSGISPTDLVLSALASCLSVGYAINAAAMGIDLKSLRLEITGNGDLQGFMNLNGVRPGLSEVSVKAFIEANAPREKLEELHQHVNTHSPIWDTIANPVIVKSELA